MNSRVRASSDQYRALLEFLEIHGDLARPIGLEGRIRSDFLWNECTNILNAVQGGVSKTTDRWKKMWADIKSKTKKKAMAIKAHARGNGGEARNPPTFSSLERRVLAIALQDASALKEDTDFKEIEIDVPSISAPFDSPQSNAEGNEMIFLEVNNVFAGPRPPTPQSDSRLSLPEPTTPPPASPSPSNSPPQRQASVTPPPVSSKRPRCTAKRVRTRYRRPNPYETEARETTALEFRRLQLEEMRDRQQHEREMRALDLEQQRVQLFSSLVNIAQSWFECYRDRNNTDIKIE